MCEEAFPNPLSVTSELGPSKTSTARRSAVESRGWRSDAHCGPRAFPHFRRRADACGRGAGQRPIRESVRTRDRRRNWRADFERACHPVCSDAKRPGTTDPGGHGPGRQVHLRGRRPGPIPRRCAKVRARATGQSRQGAGRDPRGRSGRRRLERPGAKGRRHRRAHSRSVWRAPGRYHGARGAAKRITRLSGNRHRLASSRPSRPGLSGSPPPGLSDERSGRIPDLRPRTGRVRPCRESAAAIRIPKPLNRHDAAGIDVLSGSV